MAMRIEILAEAQGCLMVADGRLDVSEYVATIMRARSYEPRFVLVDLTDVEQVHISPVDLEALVSTQLKISRRAVAVIAPRDLLYGLARQWEMLALELEWPTCVARTRAEAIAWLAEQSPEARAYFKNPAATAR